MCQHMSIDWMQYVHSRMSSECLLQKLVNHHKESQRIHELHVKDGCSTVDRCAIRGGGVKYRAANNHKQFHRSPRQWLVFWKAMRFTNSWLSLQKHIIDTINMLPCLLPLYWRRQAPAVVLYSRNGLEHIDTHLISTKFWNNALRIFDNNSKEMPLHFDCQKLTLAW